VAERNTNVPVIEAVDLRKVYDLGPTRVEALRGVSFQIARGAFVAIVGASGSGKSTLMNLIGLLDRPSAGALRIDGVDVSRLDAEDRAYVRNLKVGFVFQGFNLLGRSTAIENVELPLIYAGVGGFERRRRARESLARVGLGDRQHHMPNQLSGGQQQRVAIARALVNRPSLLLADEPTGNLDSQTSQEILELFQALNVDEGISVVMVTHEHDVASVAARVLTFRDGQLLHDGPPPADWEPAIPRRARQEAA